METQSLAVEVGIYAGFLDLRLATISTTLQDHEVVGLFRLFSREPLQEKYEYVNNTKTRKKRSDVGVARTFAPASWASRSKGRR